MASARRRGKRPDAPVDVTRNLTYRIVVLASTLTRSASRVFEEGAGLRVPVWRMLSVIGSRGPIPLGEVAMASGVDKGWISRSLVELEAAGWVRRTPDPRDGRQFLLTLTRAGRAMHLKGSRVSATRQRRLEDNFTAEEYALLVHLLARLQGAAEAMLDGRLDT